jgi:GNAT superfamily N-acetyltransferase
VTPATPRGSLDVVRLDAAGVAGRTTFVDIVNAVTPEIPTSLDELAWSDAAYPGGVRFLGLLDGRPAGAASVGRIYMYDASFERLWFDVHVLPHARRRGLGTSLWVAASAIAREAGKTGLQAEVSERHGEGVAFLGHIGFVEIERAKMVRLDLGGLPAPAVDAPPGIVITTLAARPDLAAGVYAVAREAYADIPSVDEPVAAGELDEFLARDVHRHGILPEAFAIAVDAETGDVAGWASLMLLPGSSTIAWHDMTAVGRRWRGRGVATALKSATIAWAIDHGLQALETGNDEDNAPMRAVNARLGYRPIPDMLTFRGPLAPG